MKYLRAVLFMLSTIAIYLGFALLGWGFDDLKGYFSALPRMGYVGVVILFGLVIGWQAIDAPEGIEGSKGDEKKLVRRQSLVGGVVSLLSFAALVGLPYFDRHNIGVFMDNQAIRWLGLVLTGCGYALIFLSGLALGRQYSAEVTLQKGHQLITTGLYRIVRHPRYAGLLLAIIGAALLFRSWIGLLVSVALLAVLLFRIKDEERVLWKEFEQEWEKYCATSWRLLPHIY